MSVIEVLDRPAADQVPVGKPAMVEIPEQFWSDGWCDGVRSRTYIGDLCYHSGGPGMCVQPAWINQGRPEPQCIPFDPGTVKIRVLSGKLSDYTA